ncbi:MAG: hypothetical protein R2864_04315 [Syntrophotaleaceae bacterium]
MYSRYFTPGQKIRVQTLRHDNLPPRRESMNVLFSNYELGYFDVALPHSWPVDEGSPFDEGRPLEIVSEKYGLWLKSTASFHKQISDQRMRLRMNNDLCIFRHSPKTRVEAQVGLRYSAQRGNLSTVHRQWRQQIDKLNTTEGRLALPTFARGQVNLSATGIRMPIQNAVKKNDLCLLMLDLDKASEPICTLTEVVWTTPARGARHRCRPAIPQHPATGPAAHRTVRPAESAPKRQRPLLNTETFFASPSGYFPAGL